MRKKALDALQGPTYQLTKSNSDRIRKDIVIGNREYKAGSPISWKPDQIKAGKIDGFTKDGAQISVGWDDVKNDPGWCKLIGWSQTRSADS
jgi:hypothetical protein